VVGEPSLHALRTPLHAILGLTELLLDETAGPLTTLQRELLGDVLASARELQARLDPSAGGAAPAGETGPG
jgi:signal transduction histidine kinase